MRLPWTSGWVTAVIGVAIGCLTIFAIPAQTFFQRAEAQQESASGERWACPMMDYIGSHAGPCPVCGMKLERMTAGELSREQQKRMSVELTEVTSGPAIVSIRAYGAARYDTRTAQAVIPRIAGRIVKRHAGALHVGVLVQAGDPLIDLYSSEVFAAQGELAAAQKFGDDATTQALRDRFARWNLTAVARAIQEGKPPVDTVTIISPSAGRVVARDMAEGEKLMAVGTEVMADTPLVNLVDPHAFMVVVHVPEPRSHWLRVGQPALLSSDDAGDLSGLDATISWVAPELNQEIRAREVHLHIQDLHDRLLPGSLVNARFQAVLGPDLEAADPADRSTWGTFPLIPKTAVLSTGVRQVAWRMTTKDADGRMRFAVAPLALGPRLEDESGNDRYVVRAGLKPGDQVATQGLFLIDSQAQLAGSASLLFPMGAAAPAPAHQH